jgi:hypothetical protein
MKAKQVKALESYFKTENDHWNEFAFEMLCEVLQRQNFEDPELPLKLFSKTINLFVEKHETPLQAVQEFVGELDKKKLSADQQIFMYNWVCKYLTETEFDGEKLNEITDLLNSKKEKLKKESEPVKPLTDNIRGTLKEMMHKEIECLPDTLKKLEPVQRLNILCKLMPFVLPKVESIQHDQGEL